jgi:hypothetical protein
MRARLRKRLNLFRRSKKGQAIVEFALVMVFFLFVLLAVLDLGRAYFVMVAVENAAAEGALFGMANPNCVRPSDGPSCANPNNVEYRILNESQSALVIPSLMHYEVTFPGNKQPGTPIQVTVWYDFRPILPFLSAFGSSTITIRRSATQLIP